MGKGGGVASSGRGRKRKKKRLRFDPIRSDSIEFSKEGCQLECCCSKGTYACTYSHCTEVGSSHSFSYSPSPKEGEVPKGGRGSRGLESWGERKKAVAWNPSWQGKETVTGLSTRDSFSSFSLFQGPLFPSSLFLLLLLFSFQVFRPLGPERTSNLVPE
ncbi:hypothetical protein IE53DRAFT_69810 [Violaceomyces palustris]|uniref:Uncharacterized protein n=1 Tax=Violaceomyces palustris TaxID=1673888 RepID=A0ACD0P8I2_9BASI|nr:hypothetical protein IE53DRAFT_69810 [Violaceomyces palustris]